MDYEKDLAIDPDALDVEWLQQPQLFFRYAREQAEAKARADEAKERLDVTRAELDTTVRSAYQDAGVKFTEAVVSAAIIVHPEYKEAMAEYMTLTADANLLSSAVRAMDQRKSALENLVRLHGQEYFAGPKEPRDLSQATRDRLRERNDVTKGQRVRTAHTNRKEKDNA